MGRRCQCCVSSAYLAWLAKVMKDQCIHLLCTLQCAAPCLAGWLAYLEGSAEQPFSAGSVLASARVVPDQRGAGEESLRHSFQYHFSWRVGACPVCWHSSLNLYHLQPDWVFSGNAYQSQSLEIKKKMDCSSDLDFICIM